MHANVQRHKLELEFEQDRSLKKCEILNKAPVFYLLFTVLVFCCKHNSTRDSLYTISGIYFCATTSSLKGPPLYYKPFSTTTAISTPSTQLQFIVTPKVPPLPALPPMHQHHLFNCRCHSTATQSQIL